MSNEAPSKLSLTDPKNVRKLQKEVAGLREKYENIGLVTIASKGGGYIVFAEDGNFGEIPDSGTEEDAGSAIVASRSAPHLPICGWNWPFGW
jgi:hypothetical protein